MLAFPGREGFPCFQWHQNCFWCWKTMFVASWTPCSIRWKRCGGCFQKFLFAKSVRFENICWILLLSLMYIGIVTKFVLNTTFWPSIFPFWLGVCITAISLLFNPVFKEEWHLSINYLWKHAKKITTVFSTLLWSWLKTLFQHYIGNAFWFIILFFQRCL